MNRVGFSIIAFCLLLMLGCAGFFEPRVSSTPFGPKRHQIVVASESQVGVDFDGLFNKKAKELCAKYRVVEKHRSLEAYVYRLIGTIECN